jgi:hypothetical protein
MPAPPDEGSSPSSPVLEIGFGRDIRVRMAATTPKDLAQAPLVGAGRNHRRERAGPDGR